MARDLRSILSNQKIKRIGIILVIALLLAWGTTFFTKQQKVDTSSSFREVGRAIDDKSKDSMSADTPLKVKESRINMENKAKEAEEQGKTSVVLRQMPENPQVRSYVPSAEKVEERRTFTRLPTQLPHQASPPAPPPVKKERDQNLETRVAHVLGGATTLSFGQPGAVQVGGYTAYLARQENEKKKIEDGQKNEQKEDKNAVLPSAGIAAGEILYAITNTASDSDQGSTPVMATIVTGKWKGAKCLGSFNRLDERLVVRFTKLMHNGKEYSINGYAIDPKTSLPGVRSGVDHHFLERWGGLIASSFLQGFGRAISNQGTTQTTSYGTTTWQPKLNTEEQVWSALGLVGEKAGQQFEKNFERPVTVTLKAGTEIGILIL